MVEKLIRFSIPFIYIQINLNEVFSHIDFFIITQLFQRKD
jgi:hypothetical protein